jgi:hypothetical protein
MSFVTCRLIAQTGNQLFIMAATIATALRNGVEYKIPRETSSRKLWPCYVQHLPPYNGERITNHWNEPIDFTFKPIEYKPNLLLNGYFQSEKHFKDYRKEIIEAFNFPYDPIKKVAIHVRRGDYVQLAHKHPPVSLTYIAKSINHFNELGHTDFTVFSDDINWCKDHINSTIFKDSAFNYSEGKTTIEDLTLISNHEHQIASNSTYSWWGYWLNQNNGKVGIFPELWFGPGNSNLKSEFIYPENVIKY